MSKKDFPVDCIADIVEASHIEPKLAKYLCNISDFPKSEIADRASDDVEAVLSSHFKSHTSEPC